MSIPTTGWWPTSSRPLPNAVDDDRAGAAARACRRVHSVSRKAVRGSILVARHSANRLAARLTPRGAARPARSGSPPLAAPSPRAADGAARRAHRQPMKRPGPAPAHSAWGAASLRPIAPLPRSQRVILPDWSGPSQPTASGTEVAPGAKPTENPRARIVDGGTRSGRSHLTPLWIWQRPKRGRPMTTPHEPALSPADWRRLHGVAGNAPPSPLCFVAARTMARRCPPGWRP